MGLFDALKMDTNIQEEKSDRIGGFQPLDSDIYDCTIKLAFITFSAKKAMALNLHLETADGKEVKQQIYMTSNETKGCKNYYVDKNGNKQYLPGFNIANAIANLTTQKNLADITTEEKVVSLYSPDLKKEAPTKVTMLMDMLNQKIMLGITKVQQNVSEWNDTTKTYTPTAKLKYINEIERVFSSPGCLTKVEVTAGETVPKFRDTWLEKFKGKTVDKTEKVPSSGTAGMPSKAPNAPAGNAAPKMDIFNN